MKNKNRSKAKQHQPTRKPKRTTAKPAPVSEGGERLLGYFVESPEGQSVYVIP